MRFSELDGAAVGVWGSGRETRSFAARLRERLPRARVVVIVRDRPTDDVSALGAPDARVVGPAEAPAALAGLDVLVRSPGVSIHRDELRAVARSGVPVTTATGLWLAEREGRPVIGITGTKGKSTTATLVAHLVAATGRPVHLAGNIGRPVLDLLDAPADDWVVVELSSYQIADLARGPRVAVLTNLHREHVDWHGTEAAYRADKLRLFGLPGVARAVIGTDASDVVAAAGRCPAVTTFAGPGGWHTADDGVHDARGLRIPTGALPLRGDHNALNLCAALAALDAAGIAPPDLPAALTGVRPLPHRLETILEVDGVEWVDDSISTTPESALAALAAFPDRPVVLIAGGLDRGQDHRELGRSAAVRGAVVLGLPTTGARLVAAARNAGLPADRALDVTEMAVAVAEAMRRARPGGVVLLSPAAPSYNAYRDFEARGDHFAELARAAIRPPAAG